MRDAISRRSALAGAAASIVAALSGRTALPAQTAPAAAATRPATRDVRSERVRRLEEHYAKVYGEPLRSTDRLPREIAIISLSRIEAGPTTERLFEVLKSKDRDPVILYLAWEALHARHASLSPEQRRRWVAGGLRAATTAGAFPQAMVAPLLRALAEHDPTALEAEPTQLALRVVRENDLADSSGATALDALRELVAAWRDARMVRALIKQLNQTPELAQRIDHVLRALPDPPAEGSDPRKAWNAAAARIAKLKPVSADELKAYNGKSTVFPPAERITDPDDRRWRAELEIAKLAVSDLDLVWCIDSTGSMNDENQLVAQETGLVIRVCSLVSKRARCGTIYFRHETDAALMQACCERAKSNPAWYQVKGYALTAEVAELSARMAAEQIPRPNAKFEGNVHPGGALHAALRAAIEQMPWSKDAAARKVVVMVGDSHVTPGSEAACATLVAEAKRRNFQVHALVKGRAIESWSPAVEAGGGEVFPFETAEDDPPMGAADPDDATLRRRRRRMRMMAGEDSDPGSVFGRVAAAVIRESVTPPYRDRVDLLVKILLDYAQAQTRADQNTAAAAARQKRQKA